MAFFNWTAERIMEKKEKLQVYSNLRVTHGVYVYFSVFLLSKKYFMALFFFFLICVVWMYITNFPVKQPDELHF